MAENVKEKAEFGRENVEITASIIPCGLAFIVKRDIEGKYFFKIPANFFNQLMEMKKDTETEISLKTFMSGASNLLQYLMKK